MLSILAAALMAASPQCGSVIGAQRIMENERTRWLIVGEQHGTVEAPAAFIDMVCTAARQRPVVVAVEQPVTEQAAIDAFTASNGGAAARAAFLKSAIWTNGFKDGRSSRAMLDMFESLRQLRTTGRIRGVVAFMPIQADSPAGYEKAMADELVRRSPPGVLTVAFVGTVHAMRTPVSFSGPAYMPMAGLLPKRETITLDTRPSGGSQWACMSPTDCGSQPMQSGLPRPRGIVVGGDTAPAYSGVFNLGVPATVSPPQEP